MNEISISQMLVAFTVYWWVLLPALLCTAFITLGIGNGLAHLAYKYVYEKKGEWRLNVWLTEKITGQELCRQKSSSPDFVKAYREDGYTRTDWSWTNERPWYLLDWGYARYIDPDGAWFYGILVLPCIMLAAGAVLHILPSPLFYAALTLFGVLHVARMSIRASRKIMSKLKAHVEDPKAHITIRNSTTT